MKQHLTKLLSLAIVMTLIATAGFTKTVSAATKISDTKTISDSRTISLDVGATMDVNVTFKYSDSKKCYVYDSSNYKVHSNPRILSKVSVSRSTSSGGVTFTANIYGKKNNYHRMKMFSAMVDQHGDIVWYDLIDIVK